MISEKILERFEEITTVGVAGIEKRHKISSDFPILLKILPRFLRFSKDFSRIFKIFEDFPSFPEGFLKFSGFSKIFTDFLKIYEETPKFLKIFNIPASPIEFL